MLRIVDKLHTFQEDNFKCRVCKEYLQKPQICLLSKCGHLFCTSCANSLCRKDSSVVCPECKKHQSEEDITSGDNVFSITKKHFGELVQAVHGYFNTVGDEEAIDALITKICMRTGQNNNKVPFCTDRVTNICTRTGQNNKMTPSCANRKKKGTSARRKRNGRLVTKEKSKISSDNEPFEKTVSTEVAVDSHITDGDESPASSDSSVFMEVVSSDISVNKLNKKRNSLGHFLKSSNKYRKQHSICKNVNEVQNNFTGDKNVKENNVEMKTTEDSESVLQRSPTAGRVIANGHNSRRLQTLKSGAFAESKSDKKLSQVDGNIVHVQKKLNSTGIKNRNRKKSSLCNTNDSILNDISNILSNTSENQVSPYKRESNRILKKKKVDNIGSISHKLCENTDRLEVMTSAADEERENQTPTSVRRKIARQLFAQTGNEAGSIEEGKPNHKLRSSSPSNKHELKEKKKLSLSRQQNFNKTSEIKENRTKISHQTEDGREKLKDLLNTEDINDSVNKLSKLMQQESVLKAPDANESMNRALEKASDHIQDRIMQVSDQTDEGSEDSLLNVEIQTSRSKTDGCKEMENLSANKTFNNRLSRTSEDQYSNVQVGNMDHNPSLVANESCKETPNWSGKVVRLDRSFNSPIECIQSTVLSSTTKFNGSFMRKHEIESNYVTTQEGSAKKQQTVDEDVEATSETPDILEETPADIIDNKTVGELLSDFVAERKTCFRKQNFKGFNLETSLIEKDEDLTIYEFSGRFKGTFSGRKSSVTMDTTHLIMKTDENNRVHQTFKYLQAIVLHKPVVSFDWIQQSLKCGQPLPEEEFLVHGENGENAVELSLLNAEKSLFQNFSVLVLDPILSGLRSCRIEDLLITGGAYVVNEDVFRKVPRSLFKIVLTEEITENMCREHCAKYSAITLPVSWVFDSIAEYRLAPWQKYVPRTIRKIILQEFCIIDGLLYISSDEEDD